jgi:DNA polymerase elongation subunit (family B)
MWNQNITMDKIEEPGRMLCFAARWFGSKEIMFYSEYHNGRMNMLMKLWDLMDEADAIMGYNSESFDVKHVNSEFLKEAYGPPSHYQHIDLIKTMRKHFKEPSNKLDWLAQKLELGNKVKHYGFQLWRDVMAGDKKAWALFKRYNRQDVKLTEEVYEEIRPWVVTQFNFGLFAEDQTKPTCPGCGSQDMKQIDDHRTKTQTYKQYRCGECGRCSRERKRKSKTDTGVLV